MAIPVEEWEITCDKQTFAKVRQEEKFAYIVALARAVVPNVKSALAFSKHALAANVPGDAVVDIASEAEGRKPLVPTAIPTAGR